jgi:glucose-1-phosphate thymidylyltransferase
VKGLILAGGRGTRLRPITHTSAKQLVPVANKPILFYAIEHLAEAGITDIGIIVGETASEVMAAVGDGSRWGVRLTAIPQPEPLGLAHAVLVAHDFLGDDAFVMYLGDNMLEQGVSAVVERFREAQRAMAEPPLHGTADEPAAYILLAEVPDPQRFGVAEIEDGRVVRLEEKPSSPRSNLAMAGVYVFTHQIHEAAAAISPSDRGELELADAVQWLIDHDHIVHHEVLAGWWIDTGKKDSLLEVNRRVLDTIVAKVEGDVDADSQIDGRVVVEAGARIVRSVVRGPVVIGSGAEIADSYIGPFTSVGADARIDHTEIESSVVLERVTLEHAPRLVDSLIGRDSHVRRGAASPRATRLMIGDHCTVDLA